MATNWNFWFTVNWARDPGGVQVLAGELLLIAGFAVFLFEYLARTAPALGFGLALSFGLLGAALLGWGLWAHESAGYAWWDWDWDGEGRPAEPR